MPVERFWPSALAPPKLRITGRGRNSPSNELGEGEVTCASLSPALQDSSVRQLFET